MDAQFVAIVQKLIAEQGKDALLTKGKSLLENYTGTDYQKERRLLVQVLEAGAAKEINRAGDLEACKKQQIRLLLEDYFLDQRIAAEVVDMLALVLREDTAQPAPVILQPAPAPKVQPAVSPPAPVNSPAPQNMALIQGGTFLMGSPDSELDRRNNERQHEVTVSSFYMGKYEVTLHEWVEIIGHNPNRFEGNNLPVDRVSWYDAIEYCNARSLKEGLTPAYIVKKTNVSWNRSTNGYRLPTEAEWEYACRAGTTTPFSTGNNITTDQANYDGKNYPYNNNLKGIYREETTEVGSFAPNPWGLYDMHGNVWEWCWDWYRVDNAGSADNPLGASSGSSRVIRGGSYYCSGEFLRSAYRCGVAPSFRHEGFRVVRPLVSAGGTADTRSEMPDQSQGNKQETDKQFVSSGGTDSPSVNLPAPQNMALIQGGTFLMGSPESEPDREKEEIQHQVTVSSFYMGKYPVTQKEYRAVMGKNPSDFKGDNLPVESVTWFNAIKYCNKRSQKERLTPAYTVKGTDVTWNRSANGYRLPTEAEWEYACRAGTTTLFNTGNTITMDQAHYNRTYYYNKNARGDGYLPKTTEVGSFAPNAWGLYDMHGNVCEWCWDWHEDYASGSQTDPSGVSVGSHRVKRGGGYSYYGVNLRSAQRLCEIPSFRFNSLGFRVVRSLVSAGGTADTRSVREGKGSADSHGLTRINKSARNTYAL